MGALVLTRWLRGLLFQVAPADPITFFAIGVLLLVVGVLASIMPAHRATRIAPATMIRSE